MADTGNYKRTVVIGVDDSEHSEIAFEWYLKNVCDKANDRLLIIHAQEHPVLLPVPYAYGQTYFEEWQELLTKCDRDTKHLLEHYGHQCRSKGLLNFKLYKEENNAPGEVICKLVDDEHAQLVVLGSRGSGTLRRTFLGSVSNYCVHHTNVPVAVVPSPLVHHGKHGHSN